MRRLRAPLYACPDTRFSPCRFDHIFSDGLHLVDLQIALDLHQQAADDAKVATCNVDTGRMIVKRVNTFALWASERAVSGTDGSVMTGSLPYARNQWHTLFLSIADRSHNCQNSAPPQNSNIDIGEVQRTEH